MLTRAPDAVALAVNSPGGSPVHSAALYRRIRELAAARGTKVLAFCEDVAASGGFYLACAADDIYANEARNELKLALPQLANKRLAR